uniref:Uncharacterized protein n=1 Tax=Heterorhabditis bacteriophora TaxID=37862 RepID=A0A1I7WIE5_HETBA
MIFPFKSSLNFPTTVLFSSLYNT